MNTVINFKTDKNIKKQAKKIAETMGLNLSDILNVYLRKFIKSKELYISLNENEKEKKPSKELLEAVKSIKKEYKSGKMKKFENVYSAIEYLKQL